MKINVEINQVSKPSTELKLEEKSDIEKTLQTITNENKAVQGDVSKASPAPQVNALEKVEMTSSEMKIKSEGAKLNQAQNQLASNQMAQSNLSTLDVQNNKLKELVSQHQKATDEEKKEIEAEAKELLKAMKETLNPISGESIISKETIKVNIPEDVEKADIKSILTPEHIEKNISKPLHEAQDQLDKSVEHITSTLVASQAGSMSQADAHITAQKVKEGLKEVDAKKLNAELDSRRFNVSHLTK